MDLKFWVPRLLSVVVAASSLLLARSWEQEGAVFSLLFWMIWPLALIWFSDELGELTGVSALHPVNTTTPGCAVQFTGWLFLLLILGFAVLTTAHNRPDPAAVAPVSGRPTLAACAPRGSGRQAGTGCRDLDLAALAVLPPATESAMLRG